MPPIRSQEGRLWSVVNPISTSRPFSASQPATLAPTDRHSTSLRLLFQDTERLLQDFSKKHDQLLHDAGEAVKSMAEMDETLAVGRSDAVAELKNLANTHHLAVREELRDISAGVTSFSEGFDKIRGNLDRIDESIGKHVSDKTEFLHKRLDHLHDEHRTLSRTVDELNKHITSGLLPILPTIEALPALIESLLLRLERDSQATSKRLFEKIDGLYDRFGTYGVAVRSRPDVTFQESMSSLASLTSSSTLTPDESLSRLSQNVESRISGREEPSYPSSPCPAAVSEAPPPSPNRSASTSEITLQTPGRVERTTRLDEALSRLRISASSPLARRLSTRTTSPTNLPPTGIVLSGCRSPSTSSLPASQSQASITSSQITSSSDESSASFSTFASGSLGSPFLMSAPPSDPLPLDQEMIDAIELDAVVASDPQSDDGLSHEPLKQSYPEPAGQENDHRADSITQDRRTVPPPCLRDLGGAGLELRAPLLLDEDLDLAWDDDCFGLDFF